MGTSFASIASALNERGVKSARGGKWHVSSVANVLSRASS
ncbi:recombinase family protein [Bradyrhizobium barranii subsp. barranii]|uniref:Recombinase family protein n=1 Tax=Bradyrhizobium barranii subsp. barranii TaxID=2823807 RepID=A0A939MCK9_9BRAD|nr:recombinase family protein [Bradyrhizobium barranii subsp. barranii]